MLYSSFANIFSDQDGRIYTYFYKWNESGLELLCLVFLLFDTHSPVDVETRESEKEDSPCCADGGKIL